MDDYSVEFWTLAEETGWGEQALISTLLTYAKKGAGDERIACDSF